MGDAILSSIPPHDGRGQHPQDDRGWQRKAPPPPYGQQAGDMHPTGMLSCYRLQRSWGKVMFLQASVILSTGGACMAGGHAWPGGHAWLGGVCVVGGMHGEGGVECVAGRCA